MKLPRIVYASPRSNGALLRQAVVYGLMCAVLCALLWFSLRTGRFPSRRGLTGGVGSDTPFFYLSGLVYGLMCVLTGWISGHAAVTLIDRLRHGRVNQTEDAQ